MSKEYASQRMIRGQSQGYQPAARYYEVPDPELDNKPPQPLTPTTDDDEREALAALIDAEFDEYRPVYSEAGQCVDSNAADAILAAGFRRGVPAEPAAPPAYLALDLWSALGINPGAFDAYFERNRWADTWANLLDRVRRLAGRKECPVMVDGEGCELMNGHAGPHMGANDVGSSEPLPGGAPAEPAEACRQCGGKVHTLDCARRGGGGMQEAMRIAMAPAEPAVTDEMVAAALLGYFREVERQTELQDWGKDTRKRMRDALEAALGGAR